MRSEEKGRGKLRGPDGRFVAGASGNPEGRKPGVPNKVARELREMVRHALDDEGGIEYLRQCARERPVAFLALLGRLLPAEIRASLEGALPIVVLRDYTGLEHEVVRRALTPGPNIESSASKHPSPRDVCRLGSA